MGLHGHESPEAGAPTDTTDPLYHFGTEMDYLVFLEGATRGIRQRGQGLAVFVAEGAELYAADLPPVLVAPDAETATRLGEELTVWAAMRSGSVVVAQVLEGERAVPYAQAFVDKARALVEPALSDEAKQMALEITETQR